MFSVRIYYHVRGKLSLFGGSNIKIEGSFSHQTMLGMYIMREDYLVRMAIVKEQLDLLHSLCVTWEVNVIAELQR